MRPGGRGVDPMSKLILIGSSAVEESERQRANLVVQIASEVREEAKKLDPEFMTLLREILSGVLNVAAESSTIPGGCHYLQFTTKGLRALEEASKLLDVNTPRILVKSARRREVTAVKPEPTILGV